MLKIRQSLNGAVIFTLTGRLNAEQVASATISPVPRGRVIGGSSAVNAAVAMRAIPAAFDPWAKRGIKGWSWQEVLTAYKAFGVRIWSRCRNFDT
jgi:choline dehydrogenase-like flavoprotein